MTSASSSSDATVYCYFYPAKKKERNTHSPICKVRFVCRKLDTVSEKLFPFSFSYSGFPGLLGTMGLEALENSVSIDQSSFLPLSDFFWRNIFVSSLIIGFLLPHVVV